jgi:molybdate transport system regulatory protein
LFQLMEQIQQKAFDVLQNDSLPLDSLLAAIARFSLQTSARNQLFGTVLARDHQQVVQHLDVLLSDGVTRLQVALTQRSAERLQLESGKEVLVLIKAPWIQVSRTASSGDNQLSVQITAIDPGELVSEVLMALPGGEILCATVPNSEVAQQNLQPGDPVTASFNAEHAIIATLL